MLLFIVDNFFFSRGVLRSFFGQFLAEAFSEPSLSCVQYNEGKILAHHEKYFGQPFNLAGKQNSVLRFQTDG